MASTTDLRTGNVIRYQGELYEVTEWQHVSPGNWRAFVRLKLKSLKTGKVIEDRVRAGSELDIVRLEIIPVQFLYRDGNDYVFMDTGTFEQTMLTSDQVGETSNYIPENMEVGLVYDGTKFLRIDVPTFVNLKVVQAEEQMRGNTATDLSKTVKLETGATVGVPNFIKEGDVIRIDTRTGLYVDRVKEIG
ncbi:MAG: elongation factor P [Chloroflexi bacterium]|nr:elongation factor P [Chloroflexota bacterium]